MAEIVTRRKWTEAQKREVIEYATTHSFRAAMDKYKISGHAQIGRWREQLAESKATAPEPRPKGAWREKKWTDAKVGAVLEFLRTHTHAETMRRFKVSSSQISLWRRGMPHGHYKRKRNSNGADVNGLGVLALPEKDALVWLERYYAAYMRQVKIEAPGPVDLLKALRGGK